MGVLNWMHLSCVSCVFARMHENAKVCPPSQRGMARPPWYGGSANRFFSSSGGGAPFGFVPGAAACVPGVWAARCGHGLDCYLPGGSKEAMDALSSQASTCLGSRTRQDYHLQPHPRKKGTTRLRSTNGCRNGMSGAWRRALMCGGRHIHGERLENALLTPSCPCVRLFQLVESTGRQMGGSLS